MDNIFKGTPFGGRGPNNAAPGQPVPVVNGGAARPLFGQVPPSQGFMPMGSPAPAPMLPPAPQMAAPKASPVPPPPAGRPQPAGSVPIGSKASCPVCRSFGGR